MKDEPTVIVCQPVTNSTDVIAGSIKSECHVCFRRVWIAPTGQKRLQTVNTIWCTPCFWESTEEHKIFPWGLDQLAEVSHHYAKRRNRNAN